jgi:hypothetical protein
VFRTDIVESVERLSTGWTTSRNASSGLLHIGRSCSGAQETSSPVGTEADHSSPIIISINYNIHAHGAVLTYLSTLGQVCLSRNTVGHRVSSNSTVEIWDVRLTDRSRDECQVTQWHLTSLSQQSDIISTRICICHYIVTLEAMKYFLFLTAVLKNKTCFYHSWEAVSFSNNLVRNFLPFLKPEGSLPWSQNFPISLAVRIMLLWVHLSYVQCSLTCQRTSHTHAVRLWSIAQNALECETFDVFTAVTMKNAVFWYIKIQFVLHRRHITSPLQSSAS